MQPSKIAVAADRSSAGRAALEVAQDIARESRSSIIVVGHVETPVAGDSAERYEHDRERSIDHAQSIVEELTSVEIDSHVYVPTVPTDPAEALLLSLDSEGVDFIVIGVRRRSRVGKLLLGSNSQKVILRAECPVLCVKGDE